MRKESCPLWGFVCLYLFYLEIESTSPKIISMGELSSLLICHVAAWVEIPTPINAGGRWESWH